LAADYHHKHACEAVPELKGAEVLPATKYAVFSAISDVAKMENKDA